MTGFSRAEGHSDGLGWVWEAKSVNGRSLDIRCRVPPGCERLEALARDTALARFRRGNLSLNLTVSRSAAEQRLRVNRDLLEQVLGLSQELDGRVDAAKPRLGELLGVRGVIEIAEEEEDEAAREAREAAMLQTLEDALDALAAARRQEGARLAEALSGQLGEIEELVTTAEVRAALQPEALAERVRQQVKALLAAETGISEDRLAQEVAMLAAKADVREEVDRLRAHVAAARELLEQGGAVGRRLDFLCQEFNREANTIGSKSADLELSRTGLALKAVIDQFREQAQNIE